MTDRLTAEAREALDAVRQKVVAAQYHQEVTPGFAETVLAALENLDARLKALEGK